ncbi:MAG: hypothetical protein ACYSUF_04675 [Planctomycetota bacterium]
MRKVPLSSSRRTSGRRKVLVRLTAALVVVSLLRPAGAGGLILLHKHCDDDLHAHVSDHHDLDTWRTEHGRHDACEGHNEPHGPADADIADVCCTHDDPIVILATIDLTAPSRTGAAKNLPLYPVASVAMAPTATLPTGIEQRARSPGRWRAILIARSAIAAILVRNHALLF